MGWVRYVRDFWAGDGEGVEMYGCLLGGTSRSSVIQTRLRRAYQPCASEDDLGISVYEMLRRSKDCAVRLGARWERAVGLVALRPRELGWSCCLKISSVKIYV